MVIQLIAVLNRGVVDFCGGPAGMHERGWVSTEPLARADDLGGTFPRSGALAAGGKQSPLCPGLAEGFLDGPADRRGHTTGMPIESEYAAKSLKPKWVGQSAQ